MASAAIEREEAATFWVPHGGCRHTGSDGEPAGWPRRSSTASRKVGAPEGKGAGESQDGATCRFGQQRADRRWLSDGHRQGWNGAV